MRPSRQLAQAFRTPYGDCTINRVTARYEECVDAQYVKDVTHQKPQSLNLTLMDPEGWMVRVACQSLHQSRGAGSRLTAIAECMPLNRLHSLYPNGLRLRCVDTRADSVIRPSRSMVSGLTGPQHHE